MWSSKFSIRYLTWPFRMMMRPVFLQVIFESTRASLDVDEMGSCQWPPNMQETISGSCLNVWGVSASKGYCPTPEEGGGELSTSGNFGDLHFFLYWSSSLTYERQHHHHDATSGYCFFKLAQSSALEAGRQGFRGSWAALKCFLTA